MIRWLARRLVSAAATLLLVSWVVFLLVSVAPGDPSTVASSESETVERLTPQQRAELRALYRLDEPFHRRYALWLRDVLRGEMGVSFQDRRPVVVRIGERIGLTFTLNALALALMIGIAVPVGAAAARRPGSWVDRISGIGTYALNAVPVFWAALLLQILFAVRLGWLPLFGDASVDRAHLSLLARLADRTAHLVLPVVCLAYPGLAYLSRFVRGCLLDAEAVEPARAARARGLSETAVLLRHGFRHASVPMLTLAGFLLPRLIGGAVIVETVFALPGLGLLFVESLFRRDLPVVLALTLLSGAATLAGTLMADLLYAVADPRARRA